MGVICRPPHSPVGEVGRQGLLLIFEYFNSLGVAVSLVFRADQVCLGMFTVLDYILLLLARPAEPPPPSLFFFSRHQRFHSGFLQPRKPKNCTEGHLQSVVSSLRLNTLGTYLKHFIISRISVTISHSIISATNNVFFL